MSKLSPKWKKIMSYDPKTGVLRWAINRHGKNANIGDEAGSVKADGRYRSFVYKRTRYYTHRVVWEICHGAIPNDMVIDHIDGDGLNNKIDNLRVVTRSENQRNCRTSKNSRTGVPGVNHHANGKGFFVHCANKYIGYSEDFNLAVAMRKKAETQNGYHPNHGRPAQ